MTSTGERRWGSGRRGGMTVLGKVTAPKPINLPSQRLENHGLDPNVEIVPKGTLSWGSRSSSATNPWGSSSLSPNTDGSTGSPSYLNGCPSFGGSGTRPSTGSSDKAHEPTSSAWGPNSRPSSSSGAVTSNQTSLTSLRPHSAETRPGSSQLSRFAEALSENSVAWNPATTAAKLRVTQPKGDGFALTSGDFPTLGSEKDSAGKTAVPQDHGSHGRPGSSGGATPVKERTEISVSADGSINPNLNNAPVNPWRRDDPSHVEDGVNPCVKKWQGHSQPFPGANIPPQHYDTWHGPQVNNPQGGMWYRGPQGGPPYGPPVGPGGFPVEPFSYYPPQIPPGGLANSHPVPSPGPRPGPGPRGHHPKSGDMYRPPMPDTYMRPNMPMRPGFYPGPVPCEGYYCPPMPYCNSDKRDALFMGLGPNPVYNRFMNQNAPGPGHSQGRSGGQGSTGKAYAPEQVESGHPHDTRGPYKVLLKQHNSWEDRNEEETWESGVSVDHSYGGKSNQPKTSSWENDRKHDFSKGDKANEEVAHPQAASDGHGSNSSGSAKFHSHESERSIKAVDDTYHAAPGILEAPQSLASGQKDSSLIQKIEGLNAKARASDIRVDGAPVLTLEERQGNVLPIDNAKANDSAIEAVNRASNSGSAISRRAYHGIQGRPDHRVRGKANSHEVDGWQKRSIKNPDVVTAAYQEASDVHVKDPHALGATEKPMSHPSRSPQEETVQTTHDSSDSPAQRAKVRELAKQRTKQLQEEEEERTRKQNTKARAKLEELNRRAQAGEGTTQRSENAPSDATQRSENAPSDSFPKKQESQTLGEPRIALCTSGLLVPVLFGDIVANLNEQSTVTVGKPHVISGEALLKAPKSVPKESTKAYIQSVPLKQDFTISEAACVDNAPQVQESNSSKNKRVGYKQKQNVLPERNFTEKVIPTNVAEASKISPDPAADIKASVGESIQFMNPDSAVSTLVNPRKKNNYGVKNKHKVVEEASISVLPSAVSKETNPTIESGKSKAPEPKKDISSGYSVNTSTETNQSLDQLSSVSIEENQGKGNGQWKSLQNRRMQRNLQNRSEKFHASDSVVWAPVRSINKTEVVTEESGRKNGVESSNSSNAKIDHQVQNNPKSKRAEMERYVPKPVAKEMAQQGIIQPVASSATPTTSDENSSLYPTSQAQTTETLLPAGDSVEDRVLAIESTNGGDNKSRHHKHGKSHGSWRQRGSKMSTVGQAVQDVPVAVQKPIEHEVQKVDVSSVKEQLDYYDEWNPPDGWNNPPIPDSVAPVTAPATSKDQNLTGKGKWQQSRGYRGGVNSHNDEEQKKYNSVVDNGKTLAQSSVPEISQRDFPVGLKESRGGVGEQHPMSHWQPKPQSHPANDHRGNRPGGGQNVKRVSAHRQENINHVAPPDYNNQSTEKFGMNEGRNVVGHHQEGKREKRVSSSSSSSHWESRPHSPVEPDPMTMDMRQEGVRKNGNRNNRFARGLESQGEWNSYSGQENKQHIPANRERQRHNTNSRYEYQPVSRYNNKWSNNPDGLPKDNHPQHSGSSGYRERGPNQSRHGGGDFHDRHSSNTSRVDAGYE